MTIDMKATLVKDSEFKTIGLLIEIVDNSGKKRYHKSFGVCPMPCYWTKELDMNKYEADILDLLSLDAQRSEASNLRMNFIRMAETIKGLDVKKDGMTYTSTLAEDTVATYEARIKKLIDSLK